MCKRPVLTLTLALILVAACQPAAPTATPAPTATLAPLPTETPPGGPLVIFWSIVDATSSGEQATYTVRISAHGGAPPYTYYHGDERLPEASFALSQRCPPAAETTFTIQVESADGQRDTMQGALPSACPTPAPTPAPTPTAQSAPAITNPERPPPDRPAFFALTFGDAPEAPPISVFPAGITRVFARWRYQLIPPGETVHRRVTFTPARPEPIQPRVWREDTSAWEMGSDGNATYLLSSLTSSEESAGEAPLDPGAYTLRLSLESDPYRYVEATFLVRPTAVDLEAVARFGVSATTASPQACLLWQIGPRSDDLDYRLVEGPADLLTTWSAQGFAPSPGGEYVAYVQAHPAAGGEEVRRPHVYRWADGVDYALDINQATGAPVWSADGALLAVEHASGVTVFDLADDSPAFALEGASHPRFAPTDNRLAFVQDGRALVIRTPPDGESVIATSTWETIGDLAWTPDGERLYYVEEGPPTRRTLGGYVNSVLWTVGADGAERARWSVNTYISLRDLLISPGGRYLLAKDGTGARDACRLDERLHIFNLQAEDPMRQDRTLWDLSGGGATSYTWLSEEQFLLVRQPACSGLVAAFIAIQAADGHAVWLGGLPDTPTGPACR